jgi:putative flippase GtrA
MGSRGRAPRGDLGSAVNERETLRPTVSTSRLARVAHGRDTDTLERGLRFTLVGGVVALVYLTTTTVLANGLGVPFQVALAIGFSAGLAVHFTLQRLFVWRRDEQFALPVHHQVGRYLALAGVQYGLTALTTSVLPSALGVSTESVYLVTVVVLTLANFMVFRYLIFHAEPATPAGTLPVRARRKRAQPGREHTGRVLRRGVRGRLRSPAVIDVTIATLVILLIASPLLLTRDGFAPDFTNELWLSAYQQHVISAHLHPTLFLQTQQVVFEPLFAFYGGTLFAITGGLGAILGGSTVLAFEIMTVAAIVAAYGGLFWLARQLGVRGIEAHAPAIVFVTSAYYITGLYGRGAWAEFMATSMLLLVIASALRVVRGPPRVALPAVCLVAASVVFSGSHNISLLLGVTVTALALTVYWVLSGCPRDLPWRRMAAAAGLFTLGVCLNGWFLVPDVSFSHDTLISTHIIPWSATSVYNAVGLIFNPLRAAPPNQEAPALYLQIPVIALAWGLLAIPLVWRYRRLRAGVMTALAIVTGLLVVGMSESLYSRLPKVFQEIQFPYRLQTYVVLACAGLVMLGALALTRRARDGRTTGADRVLAGGLGLAVAFGVALCAWQMWVPNTHVSIEGWYRSLTDRSEAVASVPPDLPASWNASDNYGDRTLPVVGTERQIAFNPSGLVNSNRVAGRGVFPPGLQPFATNISGGPYFVHVGGGVRVVGRTAAGTLVLQRKQAGSQPIPFELKAQLSAPVLLGRIVTAVSAAILLALAVIAVLRRRRSVAPPKASVSGDA